MRTLPAPKRTATRSLHAFSPADVPAGIEEARRLYDEFVVSQVLLLAELTDTHGAPSRTMASGTRCKSFDEGGSRL